MTLHEPRIEPTTQTCVLLAPAGVHVGKNVTDAVQQGGWRLLCIEHAVNAMATLCRLEAARRQDDPSPPSHNMLLIHRDVHVDVNGALQAAVRKHLPGVKVHEIQGATAAASATVEPRTNSHMQAVSDDLESPVLGRIGHSANGAQEPRKALKIDEAHDHDETPMAASHDVTRDEISMLLDDLGTSGEQR